ncbi:metallophosphoesterase [Lysobacter sp. Root916]|uniref:metallophosphoesterase n=1 Tax=Lysobacter sp. Root916 TaxID=1736606 RepID=UPI0009EC5AF7|nr:metallophosphoesterase [Lysobacter sp. Root916]
MTTTRFIHLSDIHFNFSSPGFGVTPDGDVRNELLRDIRKQVADSGEAQAILVSGDIAYAGKKAEYITAANWLDEVCDAAGCPRSGVLVCPGNHDIDQAVIRKSSLIRDAHEAIRRGDQLYEHQQALDQRLSEPDACRLLFAPLAEFNEFAARYNCAFYSGDNFFWERDFTLNDGSVLRVRGLNTALLSGLADRPTSLMLGARASTMLQHDGVEYLVMSHHPPSWLLDQSDARRNFDARTRLQLFGHEHDARCDMGLDYVRLYAGSVNPHRGEQGWSPGYNIIDLSVSGTDSTRHLCVEVRVREWTNSPLTFRAQLDRSHKEVRTVHIPLQPWNQPAPAAQQSSVSTSLEEIACSPVTSARPSSDVREGVHRFFRLGASQKSELVGRLGLANDEDRDFPDFERYKRSLVRANQAGLWPKVMGLIHELENG